MSGFSSSAFSLNDQLSHDERERIFLLPPLTLRTRRSRVNFLGAITSRWPSCFISRPLLPPPDEPAATRNGGDSKSDDITRIATNLTRSRAAASMVLQRSEIFSPDSLQFAADSVCNLAMLATCMVGVFKSLNKLS